jgi:regulatory protein
LRQRALDYLGKREYSYVELAQKLKAYAEESDDIPAILEDLIASAVEEIKAHELENAKAVCLKKYRGAPSSREEWAKQARFLQSRGFSFDVIKKVLSSITNDEPAS